MGDSFYNQNWMQFKAGVIKTGKPPRFSPVKESEQVNAYNNNNKHREKKIHLVYIYIISQHGHFSLGKKKAQNKQVFIISLWRAFCWQWRRRVLTVKSLLQWHPGLWAPDLPSPAKPGSLWWAHTEAATPECSLNHPTNSQGGTVLGPGQCLNMALREIKDVLHIQI